MPSLSTAPVKSQAPPIDRVLTEAHQLVLIGGLHRSGTTLFARCLAQHPAATGFNDTGVIEDEGQFLQEVYAPAREYGGPGRFGWHPGSHLDESSTLLGAGNREAILSDWCRHWDLSKHILIEKSPPNLLKTRFLRSLFGDPLQIMLLRHPIAACMATMKWVAGGRLEQLLEHWVHCHEILWKDLADSERVAVLSYGDFVRNPDGAMAWIDGLLRVDAHSAQLEVRPNLDAKYFDQFERRATSLLQGRSMRRMLSDLEPRVRALGYSLVDREHDEVARVWGERALTLA